MNTSNTQAGVTDDVLTIANQLTLLRMLLIPAFIVLIVEGERGWALLVFTVAGVTDALDGVIARRWGTPIVKKLTSMERVRRLRAQVPKRPFWSVVLLRMVVPMDVISYVLGLFTDMTWRSYALATALGLTPSAFLLAYIGKTPRAYDIIMFGLGGAVVGWIVYSTRRGASKPRRRAA